MDPIEQMPAQLNRRNWLILGLLLLVSLPFGNWPLTTGILAGGLVAIVGFIWMRRSLQKLIDQPNGGARFRYQFGYMIRLAALAVTLAVLIAIIKINPIGLVIGLSVVVINLLIMTVQRAL
jgi:hypothetical protein